MGAERKMVGKGKQFYREEEIMKENSTSIAQERRISQKYVKWQLIVRREKQEKKVKQLCRKGEIVINDEKRKKKLSRQKREVKESKVKSNKRGKNDIFRTTEERRLEREHNYVPTQLCKESFYL